MNSNKYLDDISEIKNMMSRSSRFISLSGISGILAGCYALVGAWFANDEITKYQNSANPNENVVSELLRIIGGGFKLVDNLILIALIVLALAIVTGIILTYRKAKKSGEKIWDISSKRLLINFLYPLFTGGVFCLVLIQNDVVGLVAPATLIFYGLACINASKYTMRDIRYMGLAFIIIGLISTQFIGYGLYFWALGFGVCHIVYGSLMHFKYDRNK